MSSESSNGAVQPQDNGIQDPTELEETGLSGMEDLAGSNISQLSGYDVQTQSQIMKKELLKLLDDDLLACDIQWSLFVAAANSYRYHSILRPFPPQFRQNDDIDVERLRDALVSLPSMSELKDRLQSGLRVPMHLLRILYWVLCENPSGLTFETLKKDAHEDVLKLAVGENGNVHQRSRPSHIFKIRTSKSEKWDETNSNSKMLYGYHGSRLENIHSILSNGLQQHRNTNSLFGQGIYLSTELDMSLAYGKQGQGWEKSLIGSLLSCVVLCQVLDHPSVKCQSKDPRRSHVADSVGGKVPEKYLIVRNNELIENKYLLAYGQKGFVPKVAKESLPAAPKSFLWENKVLVLVLAYGILLVSVGMANSATFKRFLRKNGWLSD